MPNDKSNGVWVDLNGSALAFLKDRKPKKKNPEPVKKRRAQPVRKRKQKGGLVKVKQLDEKPATQGLTKVMKVRDAEFVMELPDIPRPEAPSTSELPALEELLEETLTLLDLREPEGFLDSFFGRINHRIRKKTERAQLLVQYREKLVRNVELVRQFAQVCAEIDGIRYQALIERVRNERTLVIEQHKLFSAQRAAEREEAIEEAKAQAEIAGYLHQVPQAGQPSLPEETRSQKKARIQKELQRLDREEKEEIKTITDGTPEELWSEETNEKVIQIQNMYADSRDRKREEMEKYL